MSESPVRHTKLDGLRGLLSLVVALNHSFLVIAIPVFANVWGQNYLEYHSFQSKIQQIFMLLGNGGAAVSMFFILSGLVLGQSLGRTRFSAKSLTAFFVKRVIRLYPVYLFIILLTALFMKFGFVYQTFPYASTWYHWWLNFQMTFSEFLANVFFIHTYLGGVTWTLRVILLASFIFPVFYFVTKKTSWLIDLFLTALLVYASFTVFVIQDFRDLRYLYMFFLGLILPKFQDFFASLPKWYIWASLPLVIFILTTYRYATDEYRGGLWESLASWQVIGLIMYSSKTKLFDFLNSRLLLYFGQISYSLYLIHFSILYILARWMFLYLPNLPYTNQYFLIHLALFIISLAISTFVSTQVYRFIEVPSLKLSKTVSDRIQGS